MKQYLFVVMGLFLIQAVFAQKIDPQYSKVEFEVSNMGKIVKGTILNVKGTVNFEPENIENAMFDATVDPSTIDTKSKGRDKHLQKNDFFDAKNFPEIRIKSDKIVQKNFNYEAMATLTIKDISIPVVIPFTVAEEGKQKKFVGSFSLKRKDYELGEKINGKLIGLDVKVMIECLVE